MRPPAERISLASRVGHEVRWALTPPCRWMGGAAVNLVLAGIWLLAVPLRGRPHSDWAVLVGTYFAVWILADVTTTNQFGTDADRLPSRRPLPLGSLLLTKNLTLAILIGLPTLIATAVLTIGSEADHRVIVTLPRVAFTFFVWIGVGNIVSVLLPVATVPLRRRWLERRDLRSTSRWLLHLAIPYALLVLVDPVQHLPNLLAGLHLLPRTELVRGAALTGLGLAVWAATTAVAVAAGRRLGLRLR